MRRKFAFPCLLVLLSGAAVAQVPGESNSTITVSTSRTPDTFNDVVLPVINTYTYQTRLLGLLQGDPTLYYDQTFAVPFADASVQSALGTAMNVLTAANSGNPLSFLAASLDSSVPTLLSHTTVTTQDPVPTITQTIQLESQIGGVLAGHPIEEEYIYIGDRGMCAGFQDVANPEVGETPSQVYGCSGGTLFDVIPGTSNVNVNVNSQYLFTRQIQATDAYSVLDTWRLIGVAQGSPPVNVPEPGTMPLLALGLALFLLAARLPRVRRRLPPPCGLVPAQA